MSLMVVLASLCNLSARDFEGLLQMFLSVLNSLTSFQNLVEALAQVNAAICGCTAVGPAGACL
jgi:hypothetical protein